DRGPTHRLAGIPRDNRGDRAPRRSLDRSAPSTRLDVALGPGRRRTAGVTRRRLHHRDGPGRRIGRPHPLLLSVLHNRVAIGDRPYLRAAGNSVLEDYKQILGIREKCNDIVGFIRKAAEEGVKKSAAYVELQQAIAAED